MKRIFTILLATMTLSMAYGQSFEEMRKRFESFSEKAKEDYTTFKQTSEKEYNDFRDKANQEYADFLRDAWETMRGFAPMPQPEEKPIPPVIITEEEKAKPIEDNPIVVEEVVVLPEPVPQPEPLAPIPVLPLEAPVAQLEKFEIPLPQPTPAPVAAPIAEPEMELDESLPIPDIAQTPALVSTTAEQVVEPIAESVPNTVPVLDVAQVLAPKDTALLVLNNQPKPNQLSFTLFATPMHVTLPDTLRFKIGILNEANVAATWEKLATPVYNNIINECLELRKSKQLCDWSYLRMLDAMATAFLGENTDEAELFKAYIYCQSGYQMRLAFLDGKLAMLYGTSHRIYDKGYWCLGDYFYYTDKPTTTGDAQISNVAFPKEQALSLLVPANQSFSHIPTQPRTLASDNLDISVTVPSDENILAFCETYPASYVDDKPITRWAMYANKPLNPYVKEELYPSLRLQIAGKTNTEAVEILCHWVQTAFEYKLDDLVWGRDRAFFPEETLYYPYADCEDRSILLTRIVRDLLDLPCALVHYPGHLATAIAVGEEVAGDYIILNNTRFLVCDPTYIGAPIGLTMPLMDNATAQVIVLK